LDPAIRIITCYRRKSSYRRYSISWILHIISRGIYCIGLMLKRHDIVLVLKDGWYIKLGGILRANCKIGWFHTGSIEQPHWTRIFFKSDEEERACLATYDKIICVSEFAKLEVNRVIGQVSNLVVQYNPIDVNTITRLSKEPLSINKINIRPVFQECASKKKQFWFRKQKTAYMKA